RTPPRPPTTASAAGSVRAAATQSASERRMAARSSVPPANVIGEDIGPHPNLNRVTDLAPGTEFGGCRIDGVAGRGGMGVVYSATDLRLDRKVALKLIAANHAADSEFLERFDRESRLAASIDHPNIV